MVRATFEEEDEISGAGILLLDALDLLILAARGARDIYAQCATKDELGESTAIEGVGSGRAGPIGIAKLLLGYSENFLAQVRRERLTLGLCEGPCEGPCADSHRSGIHLAHPGV